MNSEQTKACRTCGQVLPLSQYNKDKRLQDGLQTTCKQCQADRWKAWYEKRKEHGITRSNSPERNRTSRMKSYGITQEDYERMYSEQGGVCAICGRSNDHRYQGRLGFTDRLCVDHSHETGELRGLLCHGCNTAIGLLHEDVERHLQVIDYLESRPNALEKLSFIPHVHQPIGEELEFARWRRIYKSYGLDKAEWMAIHEHQGGRCAICGKEETHTLAGNPIDLSVDHCHETGVVRGLLCWLCNSAIAQFKENTDSVRAAIAYLLRYGGSPNDVEIEVINA